MISPSNTVLGLDIGSTKISAVIGTLDPSGSFELKGTGISKAAGLKRGEIISEQLFLSALSRAIKRAELSSGLKAVSVVTNFPLFRTKFIKSSGVHRSEEESGQISQIDKVNVLKKAKQLIQSTDKLIIHLLPVQFKVDNHVVENPVGVFGTVLETETHGILADSDNLKRLLNCFKVLQLQVHGMIYDGISLGEVMASQSTSEDTMYIFDFGGRYTSINCYHHQRLVQSTIIPIGGETISSDIAQCLTVSLAEAERLKIIYGDTNPSKFDGSETIQILTDQGRQYIKRKHLCQIIWARVDELFKLIKKDFTNHFHDMPNIHLIGEGALLNGLADSITHRFSKSVYFGTPKLLKSYQTNNPSQISPIALGNILFGLKMGAISYQRHPSIISKLKALFLKTVDG